MALQGFDSNYYLGVKLAALQEDSATAAEWSGKDTADLEGVLSNDYGLTAEEHYQQYGYNEGLAPNAYFNADEYVLAKAQSLLDDPNFNFQTVDEAKSAFEAAWTGNAYDHYLQYGSAEGINPSNDFDESSYLADKLEALQEDSATAAEWTGKTTDDLSTTFHNLGLTALGHYVLYGADEDLSVSAVPADEKVNEAPVANPDVDAATAMEDSGAYTATADVVDTFVYDFTDLTGGNYGAGDVMVGEDGTVTITGFDSTEDILRFVDSDGDAPTVADFEANGYSVTPNAFAADGGETTVSLTPYQGATGGDAAIASDIVLQGVVLTADDIMIEVA